MERRKERVLHTRISEQLAEEIRRAADELRVPVSNLVRNVLEETFHVVEAVSENVGGLVEEVMEEAEHARRRLRRRHRGRDPVGRAARYATGPVPPAHPEVMGWQPLVFNQARSCADCGMEIEVGERGFVGLTSGGVPGPALCERCLDRRA